MPNLSTYPDPPIRCGFYVKEAAQGIGLNPAQRIEIGIRIRIRTRPWRSQGRGPQYVFPIHIRSNKPVKCQKLNLRLIESHSK
jgi:hypothetical protein